MGGWSRSAGIPAVLQERRSRRRLAVLRLLLLALFLVVTPGQALADPVPMCGELGQSIEAPPPFHAAREAVLGQAPCAQRGAGVSWEDVSSSPAQLDETRWSDKPIGYVTGQRLSRATRIRVPVPEPDAVTLPSGIRRQVERPPRGQGALLL